MCVMIYPLDDTTLVVEVGDTVVLQFDDDEVEDSGLVIKNVTQAMLALCLSSQQRS